MLQQVYTEIIYVNNSESMMKFASYLYGKTTNWNKADCRLLLVLPPGVLFEVRRFRVAIHAKTTCANMMSWIFNNAHCGLVGPDWGTQTVGLWFRCLQHAVYSQVQGCLWAVLPSARQPRSAALAYDIIHKTESTQHIAMLPKEDRATTIGNTYKNLVKMGCVLPQICSWTDKHTDRQIRLSQYYAPLLGA